MCKERELIFSIFILYSLADKWKKSPATVYKILNSTGVLDNYIIPCYDVLHTQGKERTGKKMSCSQKYETRKAGSW